MDQNDVRELLERNTAAWKHTADSVLEVAGTFQPAEWDRPTECPGWTVKDVVSHLVSVERALLGEPWPEYALPEDMPHVRHDFGRMLEIGVHARRQVPGEEVLEELRAAVGRRMAALPDADPAEPTLSPVGTTVTYAEFMGFRALDWYVHEQDIRRATGRPGGLDAPAAACAHRLLAGGLPFVVAKKAGAGPGQSATFEVGGAFPFTTHVLVGDDGRARPVPDVPAPTTTLRMDWATYVLLAAGRRGPADVRVTTDGDPDLASRILKNMAITP